MYVYISYTLYLSESIYAICLLIYIYTYIHSVICLYAHTRCSRCKHSACLARSQRKHRSSLSVWSSRSGSSSGSSC